MDVVIGAQYGDEGKGLMTDYLSSSDTLVVRFNGGAQAGHTVVTPDGRRHEFHHFGAGSFRGASTLLSRFFLVNPIMFYQEWTELADLLDDRHDRPQVLVDPRALVTTPVDMMINTAIEDARGNLRHGSVGVGVNETVTRSEHSCFTIRAVDLTDTDSLRKKMAAIESEWVKERGIQLGVYHLLDPKLISEVMRKWLMDTAFFINSCGFMNDTTAIRNWDHVVFEGAQGLRLDEFAPGFPHVTRSRTGLTNVLELTHGLGCELNVHYVTRCYTTRHGNGPLVGEVQGHPYGWIGPETNEDNQYQGKFRYAPFDALGTKEAIKQDIFNVGYENPTIRPSLVVTCLDQTGAEYPDIWARNFAEFIDLPLSHYSVGPTRRDVRRP